MVQRSPAMIFFSGSSAVGKSEMLNQLDPNKFVRVPMTARAVRETLGNPNWQDLIDKPNLAVQHQLKMGLAFKDIIFDAAEQHDGRHQVFERCLYDVCGYSRAFGLPVNFIHTQLNDFSRFEKAISTKRRVVNCFFPISPTLPYAIEEARPPESVRDSCGEWVADFWQTHTPQQNCIKMNRGLPDVIPASQFIKQLEAITNSLT